MKLSDGEKLILVMLSEIHQKLKIEDGVDSELVQSAIFSGNLWGLKWEFTGIFHDSEPTPEMVTEVVDILDMWSFIEKADQSLSPDDKAQVEREATPFGKHVKFTGFDGNGEAGYISVARFLIDELDRFGEFKGRELNSHVPFSLDAHRRMLAVFTPLRPSLTESDLSANQITRILKERIHPENRKAAAN
jgi:uncharacterized protein